MDRIGLTDRYTGWLYPFFDSLHAQIAFLGHFLVRINTDYGKRADLNAFATPNTMLFVNNNDSISSLADSVNRACLHAWWPRTMMAGYWKILCYQFFTDFFRTNPDHLYPSDTDRNVVFLLAGNLTGFTVEARLSVDNKT